MAKQHLVILCITAYITLVASTIGTPNTAFEGNFESHKHDGTSAKNNWHFVTITYNADQGTYTWKNKANRQWTLYPSSVENVLKVGTDCPYYKNGHVTATFTTNGVLGPHGELYTRKYGNALLIGSFENHKYDNGGKNNWHYVDITYDAANNNYKWTNRAGRSWTLYANQSAFDTLSVGTDCPYYKSGYTTAKFNQMGIYGVGNEIYLKTEKKPWFVGTFENHLYDNAGKNDWHYVEVTYDATNDKYIWTNRAGRSWSLYATEKEDELRVGTDCPYYANGYTKAKVTFEGILGYGNELYTRK